MLPFNWHDELCEVDYSLVGLFHNYSRFDEANAHIECTKSYTVNSPYYLSCAMEEQAWIWYEQDRLKEARSEVLCATNVYEMLGAAKDVEDCRKLIQDIEEELGAPQVASGQSDFDCELL